MLEEAEASFAIHGASDTITGGNEEPVSYTELVSRCLPDHLKLVDETNLSSTESDTVVRIAFRLQDVVASSRDNLCITGLIRQSDSPCSSPIAMVAKKRRCKWDG